MKFTNCTYIGKDTYSCSWNDSALLDTLSHSLSLSLIQIITQSFFFPPAPAHLAKLYLRLICFRIYGRVGSIGFAKESGSENHTFW